VHGAIGQPDAEEDIPVKPTECVDPDERLRDRFLPGGKHQALAAGSGIEGGSNQVGLERMGDHRDRRKVGANLPIKQRTSVRLHAGTVRG